MANYEIKYKNQKKTVKGWGLSRLRRHTRSEAVETVTFFQVIAETDSDAVFEEGEDIKVYLDGTQWFRGKVLRPSRVTEAKSKAIFYTVANAWNNLERRTFLQQWGPNGKYTSHLILNVSTARALVNVGQQIGVVLDFVIARGLDITKGDILPDASELVYVPPNEIVSAPCSAVIVNQLRWLLRQAIVFWNYATEAPTISIRAANKLPTVTLDLQVPDESKEILSVEIGPRTDLKLPGVWITYEFTNAEDGQESFGLAEDFYPPGITGAEEDVLHLTFDMQGVQITHVEQEIETSPIDATNVDWWKDHVDYLKAANITNIVIDPTSLARGTNLPNELKKGSVARWMEDVEAQDEVITINASYDVEDDGGVVRRIPKVMLTCKLTATDGETGTYRAKQSVEAADPIPVGLAEFIYKLNNVTQYEGTIVMKEQSLRLPTGNVPRVGARLNINGGRKEWEAMNAVIQAVDEDAETGETTITLAPVSTMAPSDIMEFLRVKRRRRWTNVLTQGDGKSRTNQVALPITPPRDKAMRGEPVSSVLVVKKGGQKIENDAEGSRFGIDFGGGKTLTLAGSDGAWTKALKVQTVCVKVNGQQKSMQVIGSDPF